MIIEEPSHTCTYPPNPPHLLPVSDRHQFKNDRDLLYRFRYDDGTFRSKINSSDVTARGIRLYLRLYGQFESLIKLVNVLHHNND